jgi:hypothetical protein
LSKSSTISGLRFSHHVFASFTFLPFFNISGSGRVIKGDAFDSSVLAALGEDGFPEGPGRVEVMFNCASIIL